MNNETLSVLAFIGIFVGTATIICATTIIHAVLEYKQERWKLERGIKTKRHDPHDDIIL